MSFDIGSMWSTLNAIGTSIQSWCNDVVTGIEDAFADITNVGHGIFAGLVAFATMLWDAVVKAANAIATGLISAFNFIHTGLLALGSTLGSWLGTAFSYLAAGVTWVGTQFYNFGNWLWNGLQWLGTSFLNGLGWIGTQIYNIGNWIYNALKYAHAWFAGVITTIWNSISGWFGSVSAAIGGWWGIVVTGLNNWWLGMVLGFRNKLKATLIADIAITGMWGSATKIMSATSMKDVEFGFIGLLTAPVLGFFIGEILDFVIPVPSTTTFPLIPTIDVFTHVPASISITAPSEPSVPSFSTVPSLPSTPSTPSVGVPPAGVFTGLSDFSTSFISTYDYRWDAGKDFTATLSATYDVNVV